MRRHSRISSRGAPAHRADTRAAASVARRFPAGRQWLRGIQKRMLEIAAPAPSSKPASESDRRLKKPASRQARRWPPACGAGNWGNSLFDFENPDDTTLWDVVADA